MKVLDELMIVLGVDPKKAQTGMKDAQNAVKSGMGNIKSSISSSMTSIKGIVDGGLGAIKGIFTGFGGAIMGALSIGSAFSTWKEQASEFGTVARNLKMDIADVQGWVGAMGKFGGTSSDFEQTLRGLNGQLAKMATIGSSRAGKLLESIGVDAGGIGRQRDALAVLEDISGVIENMSPDESRGILQALGFDSATIMLLQQGREGMKDLIRQKREDAVYTQEDADAVKQYNVAMGAIKKNFMGVASVLFRMVTPALTTVAQWVGNFVKAIRKHQTFLKVFFTMIAGLVTGLLIPAFLAFSRALLANPFTWVILALAGIALVIEDLIVWANGGKSALGKLWTAIFGSPEKAKATWEGIKAKVLEVWESIKQAWSEISSKIPWETLGNIAMWIILRIVDLFKWLFDVVVFVLDVLTGDWAGASAKLGDIWADMCNYCSEVWAVIAEAIGAVWEWLGEIVDAILQGIQSAVDSACAWIQQVMTSAIEWISAKWESFKSRAINAIEAVKSAISSLASLIMSKISGAVEWAIAKLSALKSAITGGSFNIDVSAGDAGGGGGGSYYEGDTNTSTTSYGVVNLYGGDAVSQFQQGNPSFGGFNPLNSNGGF